MEFFNMISGTCSIIGLFVSLFVASKVLKISDSNNNNTGEIQQGDGEQKIAKDHAILADNNSHATYNDYSGATIMGEIDEPPVLTELHYVIPMQTDNKYQEGVAPDTCEMTVPGSSNTACFSVDFGGVVSNPDVNKWIGYSIKTLPMKDWRSFVNSGYSLQFDYMATGTIKEIWFEITNFQCGKKIHKKKLSLDSTNMKYSLNLEIFKNIVEDWKSVDEICFVFFPENCVGQKGLVFITNLSLDKG